MRRFGFRDMREGAETETVPFFVRLLLDRVVADIWRWLELLHGFHDAGRPFHVVSLLASLRRNRPALLVAVLHRELRRGCKLAARIGDR